MEITHPKLLSQHRTQLKNTGQLMKILDVEYLQIEIHVNRIELYKIHP